MKKNVEGVLNVVIHFNLIVPAENK